MSQCPTCGTKIEDGGFMVICPGCRASLFFDADGNLYDPSKDVEQIEIPSGPDLTSQPSDLGGEFQPTSSGDVFPDFPPPETDTNSPSGSVAESSFEGIQSDSSFEPLPDAFSSQAPIATEGDFIQPMADDPNAAGFAFADPMGGSDQSGQSSVDSLGMESFDQGIFPQDQSSADLGPPEDPLGLNAFANSEISQAKDGLLLFRILISGIDSKEVKDSIREAIEDSRFGWDAAEIMSRINKGDLKVENVSPVKASILINRIKRLPVRIRWEQYAITQMEDP